MPGNLNPAEVTAILSERAAAEYGGFCIVDAGDLRAAIDLLRFRAESEARIRALHTALAPFAKLADDWAPDEDWPGDRPIYEAFDHWPTVNDCRRAKVAWEASR